MKYDPTAQKIPWNIVLLAGMAAILTGLMFRDHGLYASVFGDEWSYSSYSRLSPISDAKLPSYLYLWIYRLTNQCGSGFLDCARVLNAAFFVAAAPFLFAIFRKFTGPGKAVVLALASIAGPANSFTVYFMPESLYYLFFWILSFWVLRPYAQRPWSYGAVSGLILGLMCLIKLHALFMLAAFCAYVLADAICSGTRGRGKPALAVLAASIACFFATRFGLGYVLGGPGSLSLLGEFYQVQAQNSSGQQPLDALAWGTLKSAWGHLLALCFLFGPLLAGVVVNLIRSGDEAAERARSAMLFTLATLGGLVAITGYFTASMGTIESGARLHMRYYDFCLPLLLLGPLAWRGSEASGVWLRRLATAALIVIALLALYAGAMGLRAYTPFIVDAPELIWINGRKRLLILIGLLGAAATLGFLWSDFRKARWHAIVYYLLIIGLSTHTASKFVRHQKDTDAAVNAGNLLRSAHPGLLERSQFIGDNVFTLVKAKFYTDSLAPVLTPLDKGSAAEPSVDWTRDLVVSFGETTLPEGAYVRKQSHEGFTLYWLDKGDAIDFKQAQPRQIRSMSGLSPPETFGRWSNAQEVLITLDAPMANDVRITLTAIAFGPNVGKPIPISIGNVARSMTFEQEPQTRVLEFHGVKDAQVIRIGIPQPTSPASLGMGQDPRLLGIGLSQLRIGEIDPVSKTDAPAKCEAPHCSTQSLPQAPPEKETTAPAR
ncbi:DUF7024 domain-containing protein [Lysobacter sp. Hz 25]|uniref:DUF7024 domain-containing protein n=1 Tax=Lysobacter sp. Hz 25 TaxID=3383698 RepID=UPI0038D490B5